MILMTDMDVHFAAKLLEGPDWRMAPLAKYRGGGARPPRIDAPESDFELC